MKEKDKKTGILKNAALNNLFQFLVLVGFLYDALNRG